MGGVGVPDSVFRDPRQGQHPGLHGPVSKQNSGGFIWMRCGLGGWGHVIRLCVMEKCRGGGCPWCWGGGKETTALVLEELSEGLNEVSAVAKGQAECRSPSEPAGLC